MIEEQYIKEELTPMELRFLKLIEKKKELGLPLTEYEKQLLQLEND